MIFAFAVLMLPLFVQAMSVSVSSGQFNDDYCDSNDGTDETTTSACAGVSRRSYECIGDYEKLIPISRVGDGICDCCDGSDEINSAWPITCANTCLVSLADIKASLGAQYTLIKQGGQKKREYENLLLQNSKTMALTYEKLIDDQQKIKDFVQRIKIELGREVSKERSLRFKLIRSRQSECARGVEEMCNFFHPEFYNDKELLDEGIPEIYQNEKKRLVNTEDIDKELQYLQGYSGFTRVSKSICPHRVLLPDDTMVVWKTVGEYVAYMSTAAGRNSVVPNLVQMKKNALFGPYLDDGAKGYTLAAIHVLESVGIACSPLAALAILISTAAGSISDMIATHSTAMLSSTDTLDPAHVPFSTFSPTALLVDILQFFNSSQWSKQMGMLNPYRYSLIVTALDIVHPYTQSLLWAARIVTGVPSLYNEIYFTNKIDALPQRRQTCLLREGLSSALNEQEAINKKIADIDVKVNAYADKRTKNNQLWELLREKCLTKVVKEYSYTFCFFGRVTQGSTHLGTFAEPSLKVGTTATHSHRKMTWDKYVLDYVASWLSPIQSVSSASSSLSSIGNSTVHWFQDGQLCHISGKTKPRAAKAVYRCHSEDAIIEVEEAEVCVYSFVIGTPVVCSQEEEALLLKKLEKLGVFS